jgi:hypothetical protein
MNAVDNRITKPDGFSDQEWSEHLKQVANWTGYDGLSAQEVSDILMAEPRLEAPEPEPAPETQTEPKLKPKTYAPLQSNPIRDRKYWTWEASDIKLLDRQDFDRGREARKRQEKRFGIGEPEEEHSKSLKVISRVLGSLRRLVNRADDPTVGPVDIRAGSEDQSDLYPIQPVPPSGRPKLRRKKKRRGLKIRQEDDDGSDHAEETDRGPA